MGKFDQYLLHPVEREIREDDACIELICSKDHPILPFFYESRYIRKDYVLADRPYALANSEILVFTNTEPDNEMLGATLSITIGGKELTTDRNCMIAVPAFVPHGPIKLTNVTSTVLSYIAAPAREHISMPESFWAAECPAPQDCILYYNGDAEDPERRFGNEQNIIMKMVRNPLPGSTFSILRRFYPTQNKWTFASGSHLHDNMEILCFYPGDPSDPYHIHGECEMVLFGEKHIIDRPTVAYFPPYLPHCPLNICHLESNMFWHSYAPDFEQYTATKVDELGEDPAIFAPW